MASQNILILTSNTGGGHRSAANALENSFNKLSPDKILVKITQVLEESHYITRKAADLYNFLLRDHQDLMKYYFWAINKLKPNESKLIFKSAMGYALKLFEKMMPNVIVSVHPMTQHFFAYILKRLHLQDRIPLLTVVTDPYQGFWKGWACHDVQQYYVASDNAKSQLIDFGVMADRIKVMGLPVHSKFKPVNFEEKITLKRHFDLDPSKFTVFVNAGWVGGGNIPKIYDSLIKYGSQADLDIQVVFLTGNNPDLGLQANQIAKNGSLPVKILDHTTEVASLMQAADIMVSKLGALTTFEALSCQLPIIADLVTTPMPQELQTALFLEKNNAGIMLRNPTDIVSTLQPLIQSTDLYHTLQQNALQHGRPGASDLIAQDVLSYLNPGLQPTA
ncbi:MAG: glycosyltransferase [Cyanobacteria bacterium P01_H01_bin.74]